MPVPNVTHFYPPEINEDNRIGGQPQYISMTQQNSQGIPSRIPELLPDLLLVCFEIQDVYMAGSKLIERLKLPLIEVRTRTQVTAKAIFKSSYLSTT